MTELARQVLKDKYLAPNEHSAEGMWNRIAHAIASVEEEGDRVKWQDEFCDLLDGFKFVPGGRIMHGAGREDANRKPSLSNCYVIPILEDSIEGIYQCLAESAQVYRTGGGVGTDLSVLRPKGAPVNATIDTSPGVCAFMNLFSVSTNAISQAGRRGALMLTLRVDHPDIEDFIRIKSDSGRTKVEYANISVLLTDEFMDSVDVDADFPLRWGGKVYRTVKARELWDKIVTHAHASAEPGLIFWDRMKAYHNVEYAAPLSSTNPCGEQPLAKYTACNLGNINVAKYVRAEGHLESRIVETDEGPHIAYDPVGDGKIVVDMSRLGQDVKTAVRFLDNVITYNEGNHALDKIADAVNADRRVGLGITGLADMLVQMEIPYDSERAIKVVDVMMQAICNSAYAASVQLSKERGAFPLFDNKRIFDSKFIQRLPNHIKEGIRAYGLRNSTLLTCPPVGTGSIVAECSSGIEPIFATSYNRRVKQDDGETFKDYKVYHPLIGHLFGNDDNLPDYVRTAHDINPYFRVKMQATIQQYVDTSISSTINLDEDVSMDTVKDIYWQAYKQGCKGITIYREGSRVGILQTNDFAEGKKEGDTPLESSVAIAPRERPAITRGTTEKIVTGEGNAYITINADGEGISEVFVSIGRSGGYARGQSEAIGRLISLGLRAGVDPQAVIKSIKGIAGPTPIWDQGQQVLSVPDAVAIAMSRYLERENGEESEDMPPRTSYDECPDCHGHNIIREGGCETCSHCGYSKCG